MASCRHHAFLLCAVLILAGPATWSKAEKEASLDDEATVETVEENLDDDYKTPSVDDPTKVYLAESFDDVTAFNKRWVKSEAKKQGVDEKIAKYDGKWEIQAPKRKIFNDDLGLVLTTEAKHAAISTLLDKPFLFMDKPLVVQYEVTMQEGQVCGGAYIKLLSEGTNTKADLRKFYDQTPYTIMFGPDKCGNDNKLHFIMRYQNPKNGSIEEKHSKKPSQRLDDIYKDKEPHLYTLIVRPDNTFYVYIDNKEVNRGSLLEDMTPPINPPEEIDDPNDKKPEDWDEREKIVDVSAQKPADWDEDAPAQIPDPNAVKPDGWLDDEPATIPDPDAKKPEDWDDEMDGEWEAPLIDNPACAAAPGCGAWQHPTIPNPNFKGKWRAPLIPNPNYRGKWTPRRIPNPHHFKDEHPFRMTPITAVGFELWSMSPQLLFDNLIVTEDPDVAAAWAEKTFVLKKAKISRDSQTLWGRMLRAMNYKPAYWAVYGAYCAFPIICYIVYLIKRVREPNEDSVVERAFKFADENRWVYGVILVATFLFIGFVAYLVLGPKNVPEAEYKKTDMVTEDDPHDEEGEQQEPAQEEAEAAAEKPGKASLEHAEEPVATETTPLVDTEAAGDGQRKRKPRKE